MDKTKKTILKNCISKIWKSEILSAITLNLLFLASILVFCDVKYEVSDDGLEVTVKLRDGLKWHDGEKITADDVIWNFEVKANPDNKSSSGTKVNGKPVSVEKIDELTSIFYFFLNFIIII